MSESSDLLKLQDLDLALMRLHRELDEMPEKKAILAARKRTKDLEALRGKAQAVAENISREVARDEDEAVSLADKIESEQAKVMSGSVTNPKEVQAITREMDSLRRRKEKLEMAGLEAMEAREKADAQVAKVDAAITASQAEEARQIAEFKRKGGAVQGEIVRLEKQRGPLTAGISGELLARYEELRASKGGIGAARLQGVRCGACRVELPGEKVQSLRTAGEIGTCPNCRRLLVVCEPEDECDESEEAKS